MITVSIRYFNILASYTGVKRQTTELPEGSSTLDLVRKIGKEHSAAFRAVVLQEDQLNPHLRVFRNNALVDGQQINSPLADGDELILFPAVAGG